MSGFSDTAAVDGISAEYSYREGEKQNGDPPRNRQPQQSRVLQLAPKATRTVFVVSTRVFSCKRERIACAPPVCMCVCMCTWGNDFP